MVMPSFNLGDMLGGGEPDDRLGLSSPSPTYPEGAPGDTGRDAMSGMEKFAQIMKRVVPLLVAAGAYKQGTLGSFTGGYLDAGAQRQRAEDEAQDQQLRREQNERSARAEQRAIEEMAYRREQDRLETAQTQESQLQEVLRNALAPLAKNPIYADGISVEEAAGLAIPVPGLGNVSVADALGKIGVAQDKEGTFYPFESLPAAEEDLVAVPSPSGRGAVYGPKVKGAPVYERPRVPREPKEPKQRTIKVTQGTEGAVVTVDDPVSGTSIQYTEDDLLRRMAQEGISEEHLDAILTDRAALAELLK